jgi:hypothetical protein
MVEATIDLHIARKRRIKHLASWGDPVKDGAFQTLRIIRSGAGSTLLDLGHIMS